MVGTIQFVNKEKAYGFIQSDKYPKGVFFHLTDFNGTFDKIEKGDAVTFDSVTQSEKGFAAKNVEFA